MAYLLEGRRLKSSSSTAARLARSGNSLDKEIIKNMITSRLQETVGLNLDQDVKQYQDIPGKRLMPYRVRRLVSPFEFYLEFANFPEDYRYQNWFWEMQAHYDDESVRDRLRVFEDIPIPGRCYACRDFKDHKWHRVRLHYVKKHAGTLMVFYLDLGKMQETTISHLLELEPRFSEAPAQVFRCHLADVLPASRKETLNWSPEACKYFEALVRNKEFLGIVLCRTGTRVTKKLPDFFLNFGIVLVEVKQGTRTPKEGVCTLNAHMVDTGFAVSTGVSTACRHTTEIEGYVPFFDHLKFDRSHGFDPIREPPIVSYIPPSEPTDELEADSESIQKIEEKEPDYNNTTEAFPVEFTSKMAAVKLVYILDPSCIIVHMKSKKAEMDEMGIRIGLLVENKPPLTAGRPGMFVACRILDSSCNADIEDYMWCRGVVKTVTRTEVETYKVLMTDYGNEMTLTSKNVRNLPSIFHEYPSFAVRVHLDVEGLRPDEFTGWSVKAEVDFRKRVYSWQEGQPSYFIYRPRHAQVLDLENYNQKVRYDYQEEKWYPFPGRQAGDQIINDMKTHPMLYSLFVSFGVDIQSDVSSKSKTWRFERLSDTLIAHNFAGRKVGTVKDNVTYHKLIIEAASSGRVERKGTRGTGEETKSRPGVRAFSAGRGIRNRQRDMFYDDFYD